jgi:hypothetical protein
MNPRDTFSDRRPFYLWMVLWGKQFQNSFLQYCLPSLLAFGNLPSVAKQRALNFVIATTPVDRQELSSTAIFRELQRYVTPTFIDLPSSPPNRPKWLRAVDGKKLCCDFIFAKRAYAIFISPDCLYADGCISRLDTLAREGAEVVLNNAYTIVEEERFFPLLSKSGFATPDRVGDSGIISITPRRLVDIAMQSLHSKWMALEWDARYFSAVSGAVWWRVPGDNGMVFFSLGTEMTLADYAIVREHDSAILDHAGTDGDYTIRNFAQSRRFHIVRDSDEMYMVCCDPASYGSHPLRKRPFFFLIKGAAVRAFNKGFIGHKWNRLQRLKLFIPTRIHTERVDEEIWCRAERRAFRALLSWLDPPEPIANFGKDLAPAFAAYQKIDAEIGSIRYSWLKRNAVARSLLDHLMVPWVAWALRQRMTISQRVRLWMRISMEVPRRLVPALRGDRSAIRWWSWRLRKSLSQCVGRPFSESRPETPDWL